MLQTILSEGKSRYFLHAFAFLGLTGETIETTIHSFILLARLVAIIFFFSFSSSELNKPSGLPLIGKFLKVNSGRQGD